jgi:uncharacterized iron-regulated membrane protein
MPQAVLEVPRSTPLGASKKGSFLVTLHLWLGLSLGALLVLIALSGSTMIFRYELERFFYPSLTHTSGSGAQHLDACLVAAQSVNPQKSVRTLRLPTHSDGTLEWLTIPIGQSTKEQATTVYTDPYTCAVLGTRGPGKDVMSFLVNFHHALFLKKNGAYLQTCVALTAVFLAVSGLIQWWPRSWSWSRLRPRASSRPLHYAVGFWFCLPLIVIASTAIFMAWRSEITKALLNEDSAKVAAAKSITETRKSLDATKPKTPLPLSLDAIMSAARSAKPEASWRILTLPLSPRDATRITYQLPGEYGRAGNNQIALKQNPGGTPRVTSITELRNATAEKRFLTLLATIHYGEFAGIVSRLLWCLTGFMPAVLFASGLRMYRRRLLSADRARRALADRNMQRSAPLN